MPMIVLIVVLAGLRFFEVGPFADLSWWWIVALFALVFLWFEFGEKMLGLDKKRAHDELEKAKQERIKKTFR